VARRHGAVLDVASLLVEIAQQVPHDPVADDLGLAAEPHGLFVEVGQGPRRGQHARVVDRDAVLLDEAVLLLELQLGERPADLLDPLLGDHDGDEVRVGEVAVVVGLLLAAHGVGLTLGVVPETRLLHHLAAALQDVLLALDLVLQGPLDVAEGVHVLELRAGAEGRLALRADGDVGVAAEAALLHVAVADLEIDECLMEASQVGCRLLGAPNVRFADDLDQRHAGPVQVDKAQRLVLVVHQLPRILLHVDPRNPDPLLPAVDLNLDPAVFGRRLGIL